MSTEPFPTIVLTGGDYEHTLGLGGLQSGVQVVYRPVPVPGLFAKMLAERCFEACEFSLANYLTLRANGEHWMTAVPVFPYRAFRHSALVTRRESDLTTLAALGGRRVGVDDYSMTAAVVARGLLLEDYGVDHRAITWVTRRRQRFPFPAGATVETVDGDLEDLLCEGRIDALLSLEPRDYARPVHERRLRPILADAQGAERAYFERTGLYPIHHCVVIRNDVLERIPAAAGAIVQAYTAAKDAALRRSLGATFVPWGASHWNAALALFGGDPLPYGLTPVNRRAIAHVATCLREQGFITSTPDMDAIFAGTH